MLSSFTYLGSVCVPVSLLLEENVFSLFGGDFFDLRSGSSTFSPWTLKLGHWSANSWPLDNPLQRGF